MSLTIKKTEFARTWVEAWESMGAIEAAPHTPLALLPKKATSHKRTLVLNITQENIDNGKASHTSSCAIALAVGGEAMVNTWNIYKGNTRYRTPPNARNFIYRFDTGLKVRPIVINARRTTSCL